MNTFVRPATATTGKTALAIVAILSVLLSLFAIARPVIASHTDEGSLVLVPSEGPNAECIGYDFGYKLNEAPPDGTHTYTYEDAEGNTLFSITITGNSTGTSASFSGASIPVSRVVLKGGTQEDTVQNYDPPVTSGGPFTRTQQISHISFCGFTPPSITVDKTGDLLSKITDQVTYTVTIRNTGTITAHKVSITDTLAGDLTANAGCGASLEPGASCQITYTLTVPAGASDPWVNEVTAVYSSRAAGAGGRATVKESHSVNLFQPGITVTKAASPASVPVGGTIAYRISIRNSGSADSPALVFDTIADSLQGNLKTSCAAPLAVGAECVITYTRAAGTTAGQVCNTVSVTSHPDGFPNNIAGTSTACVTVTPLTGTFSLLKVDNSTAAAPRSGAVFTLTRTGFSATATTTTAGTASFTGLTAGDYSLTETTPPTGCTGFAGSITIRLAADGTASTVGALPTGVTFTSGTLRVVNTCPVIEVTLGGNPTPTPTPVVRQGTLAGVPDTAMEQPMDQLPVVLLALLTLGSLGYLGRRNLMGVRNRR